mmetsp:Transcript_28368/g.66360  ORF Transcript_28368/g.66360 Transcript_28368/m.66360 type:complete len:225 (+) Transcript_28368:102-776(+)
MNCKMSQQKDNSKDHNHVLNHEEMNETVSARLLAALRQREVEKITQMAALQLQQKRDQSQQKLDVLLLNAARQRAQMNQASQLFSQQIPLNGHVLTQLQHPSSSSLTAHVALGNSFLPGFGNTMSPAGGFVVPAEKPQQQDLHPHVDLTLSSSENPLLSPKLPHSYLAAHTHLHTPTESSSSLPSQPTVVKPKPRSEIITAHAVPGAKIDSSCTKKRSFPEKGE